MSIRNHSHCTQDEKNPDDICPDCFPYIPPFEDWKRELSNEKEIELTCEFYSDKIGILNSVLLAANPRQNINYELAKDAEDFMIDSIRELHIFESEWTSFLKERYKEEGEG